MASIRHATEPSEADGGRSDVQLLIDHTQGDRDAFEHLVRRHEHRLWSVALRTCRDPAEAQDALQDALISAYRGAGSFQGRSAVGTWLHRIVVNACLDRLRRQRRAGELPVDDETRIAAPDVTGRVDDRIRLQTALDGLPAAQRLAVLLVDVEGYSVAEAATVLHTAPGTVKSRCSRGRAALAHALRDEPVTARGVKREPTGAGRRRTSQRPTEREGSPDDA